MTTARRADLSAEVAIIGGGPIGIELAVGLKLAGVRYIQLEAGAIGSTMGWWSPGTRFFSSPERIEIAGVPLASVDQDKATREQYLAYLRGVAQQFDLRIEQFTRVTSIHRLNDGFEMETMPSTHGVGGPEELAEHLKPRTMDVTQWRANRVVLAIGNMHRPRMLNVPGEDLPHVSHYLGEVHGYFDRRVLIVGGKNSAAEAAIRLHRAGSHATISYRGGAFDPKRVKYWLKPELEWLISKGRIGFHPRTIVQRIAPHHVELACVDDAARRHEVPADSVLLMTGYVQDAALLEQFGVALAGEERAPIFNTDTMETTVPGIHIAGTAAGGSQQRAKLFIENSHAHVRRIVKAIAGFDVPWRGDAEYETLAEA